MNDRPNPAAIVADADVLAADVLVEGDARAAMDVVRSHSWIDLYASNSLLSDAEFVIEQESSPVLAEAWRDLIEPLRTPVEHPSGDHPAIASALHAGAAHVLSYDPTLLSAAAGTSIRSHGPTSVKRPDGFLQLFDPAALFEHVVGGTYSGPDRDPRA